MPEYLTKVQIAASFRRVSEELAKVSYNRFARPARRPEPTCTLTMGSIRYSTSSVSADLFWSETYRSRLTWVLSLQLTLIFVAGASHVFTNALSRDLCPPLHTTRAQAVARLLAAGRVRPAREGADGGCAIHSRTPSRSYRHHAICVC